MLDRLGHPLVDVDSGREALRAVSAQRFAVILMDVRMPGMSGYETAKRIRARGELGMTPIIFMTAFARDDIETTAAYASGAVDFIFSPISGDALRAKVTAFVELFARAHEHQHSLDSITALNASLRDSEVRAQAVLQNVADGIVTVDEEGLIESVNRSALALFGYESGDVIGQPLHSIVAPSHQSEFTTDAHAEITRRSAGDGAAEPIETRAAGGTGQSLRSRSASARCGSASGRSRSARSATSPNAQNAPSASGPEARRCVAKLNSTASSSRRRRSGA